MGMEQIAKMILDFFVQFAKDMPILASVILIMGTFRMFVKPIIAAIEQIVKDSETKKDDELLGKVQGSIPYKVVMFLIDYFFSLKNPTAKK